jgi:hypothetical protein
MAMPDLAFSSAARAESEPARPSTPPASARGGAPWPAAAFLPAAPVKLGLLINPHARALRAQGHGALQGLFEAAGPAALAHQTRDAAEITPTLDGMARAGVNVLAVAGGDGTLHHAINALSRLGQGAMWPGTILVLRGGTLNIVARSLGPALDPAGALREFVRDHGPRRLGELSARSVPLLRVRGEALGDRRGFIFGSEMVKNALELYDQFGGGYEGLSRFLFEAARGYMFHTDLWKRESWRLTPLPVGLTAEGQGQRHEVAAYSAAIACAVDLVIGGGVRAVSRRAGAAGFHARVITETRTGPLLRLIPALMREGKPASVLDLPEATALELHGAYTLDGECFGSSTRPPARPAPLTVSADGEQRFIV